MASLLQRGRHRDSGTLGSREVSATAPYPHPLRGLGGREGAGASRSPSDGEMWPFTFTLQCQPLNHCLRARAQGCSPSRQPTKPPLLLPLRPPGTRAPSPPPPGRPGRDGSWPRRRRPRSNPPFLSLSFPPPPYTHTHTHTHAFCPKDLSQDQEATGSGPKLTRNLKFPCLLQRDLIRKTSLSEGSFIV